MRQAWICLAVVAVATAPVAAEPWFAISEDTLVARMAAAPSWVGDDNSIGASLKLGSMINRGLLAADLDLGLGAGDVSLVTVLPSVGLKLKFLSTPQNMGFTYVHVGVRASWTGGELVWAPAAGVRDFITYDIAGKWAFALEWHALVSVPTRTGFDNLTLDGGVAAGVARAEATPANFAVLVGWKRDRVELGSLAYVADGVFVTVSHQWR